MKRILFLLAPIIIFLVIPTLATASKPTPTHKVTLCHKTGSQSNPYVQITVDVAAGGLKAGHEGHPGDIIPAFTYTDKNGNTQSFPGKNLQLSGYLSNDCKAPTAPPTIKTPTPTAPTPATPTVAAPVALPSPTPAPGVTPHPEASQAAGHKPSAPTKPVPLRVARLGHPRDLPYTGISGSDILLLALVGVLLVFFGFDLRRK